MRGDTSKKEIAIVFTGDLYGEGGQMIVNSLRKRQLKASFFLTGNFYRNPSFQDLIKTLKRDGHYLGPHSDRHLLYCSWTHRDSVLVSQKEFERDLVSNYKAMEKFGIKMKQAIFFIPPYEWYNDSISEWTKGLGVTLVNFTPGTRSTADYTTPDLKNYRSSEEIMQSIKNNGDNLNGFILLLHVGTDPKRTDKFYNRLPELLDFLRSKNYDLVRIDDLLD